jgi:tetratricopeptide (TPR) repeat protein
MEEALLQKIDQYLHNEMPPHERTEFELQIAGNDELRNYIQLFTGIDKTMQVKNTSSNENELRQTLQQMNRKYFTGGSIVKQGSFKKWLAIAASVIIVVAVSIYFLFPGKPAAEKLYAQFAKHDALNIQLRGNKADSIAQNAAVAFNKKEYTAALPLLQNYVRLQADDIQMEFSLAVCYMETGKYNAADTIFTTIAAGQTAYAATAQWYKALLALKQKEYTKCRAVLNTIPASSSYAAKAKELLAALPD